MFRCATYVSILAGLIIMDDAALITRSDWGAKPPTSVRKFTGSIRYVVVHHSDSPAICTTTNKCKATLQSIQNYHMKSRNWTDIGYSFAVGGDGNVYQGRGFNIIGSHAPGYNKRSVGLVFIGNFQDTPPPNNMITAAKNFISEAAADGKLSSNYKIIGHRQAGSTACPGNALFDEIKTWTNWAKTP